LKSAAQSPCSASCGSLGAGRSSAGRFLAKARKLLDRAAAMLDVALNDDAGRTAYLAGFHAVQAFIYERTGKVFKSHKGVHTEFCV
jgi:uncharacterized protein (UPF0332 family)